MRMIPVTLVFLLGACADGEGSPPVAGPDEPTSTVLPSPTGPLAEPPPSIVEVEEGLVDPRPVALQGVEPLGPRQLLATFYGGVDDCYGVARVNVDETPDAVVVTVYEGAVPDAGACIDIALFKGVQLLLRVPLGDREVVDGAS